MEHKPIVDSGDIWANVHNVAALGVVQVIAQVALFNWLEPYTIYEQDEVRGTGFFIDAQGYIVTNAHVINEATAVWIHVALLGRQAFFVDIVSMCPDRDFALLRLRDEDRVVLQAAAGEITPLVLGDSDQIQSTEQVLVLGYPLGQHGLKSTTGVVSGREYGMGRAFLQITAPINLGSSGGPLINDRGQVIGITIASVLGAQNVGYAVPVNELKMIVPTMMQQVLVRKGELGFRFNHVTDAGARFLKNPVPAGLYISMVFQGSLLERAGVLAGDMLYVFNGFRLDAFGDAVVPWSQEKVAVHDLISRLHEGDALELELYRAGERVVITTVFKVVPPYAVRQLYPAYEHVDYEILGGIVIMQLALNHIPILLPEMPYLIEYTKEENCLKPLLIVTHVVPGSLAQLTYSVEPGCIIKEVNGILVGTLEEFRTAVQASIASDFLTILLNDGVLIVLPLRQLLADEARLADDFVYPISATVQALIEQVKVKDA